MILPNQPAVICAIRLRQGYVGQVGKNFIKAIISA
jgi:hypothetical protein